MSKKFVFKIQLKNVSKPPVWRRVEVPCGISFKEFSDVILQSMGWAGGHLWEFSEKTFRGVPIAIPHEDDMFEAIDARKRKLRQVFKTPGQKMMYVYDFGDTWEHRIELEEVIDSREQGSFIRAAKGKCPPENCGGPYGYLNLKETLNDPKSPDYAEMLERLGLEDGKEWDATDAGVDPGEPVGTEDFDEFFS